MVFSLVFCVSAADTYEECITIPITNLSTVTWVSAPPSEVNAGLLAAGKALMQGIYTRSPDAPDFLPGSYLTPNNLTRYVSHTQEESSIYWEPNETGRIRWISSPDDNPKGWSGVVDTAGQVQVTLSPGPLHSYTDCSGLITALFTYANTRAQTKFTSWKAGSSVPEAGCKDPDGRCNSPNNLNYYSLISKGDNGWFKNVTLDELQPGDIIASADTRSGTGTGHVMLVAAVSSCRPDPLSRVVVVIDATDNPHSFDTRSDGITGLGMGAIKVSQSEQNKPEFYWSLMSSLPETGSVVLGRAM